MKDPIDTIDESVLVTVDMIEAGIDKLRTLSGDFESAHGYEDSLMEAVLRAIADGRTDKPSDLAAMVLRTSEVEFQRVCA